MVAIFGTNASGAAKWPSFEPMQVAPSSGQNVQTIQIVPSGSDRVDLKYFGLKKISQVMDSIPWVRCASGNVLAKSLWPNDNRLLDFFRVIDF